MDASNYEETTGDNITALHHMTLPITRERDIHRHVRYSRMVGISQAESNIGMYGHRPKLDMERMTTFEAEAEWDRRPFTGNARGCNTLGRAFLLSVVMMLLVLPGHVHGECVTPDCAPAEGWDNFANNFGSDMAPLLALFGEQVTKQYMSESLDWKDNLLFALAPLGIITAMVAAIRVAGGSILKAVIGRAKETYGTVEADLMSSTSSDVCELWSNGGIVRVIGTPELLQLVWVREHCENEDRGLRDFRESETRDDLYDRTELRSWGVTTRDDREWKTRKLRENGLLRRNPPNVSLNISLKPIPTWLMFIFISIGVVLQSAVLAFAAVSQYILRLPKNNSTVPQYSFPVLLLGTFILALGCYLCAEAVETSTEEIRWDPKGTNTCNVLWLQKGGQKVGDQQFEAFAQISQGSILTSHRERDNTKPRKVLVSVAVTVTFVGFVAQFFALRAAHSSVTVMQLVAIVLMTTLRSLAHLQRHNENKIESPQQVEGFELDWLAKYLGDIEDWQVDTTSGPIEKRGSTSASSRSLPPQGDLEARNAPEDIATNTNEVNPQPASGPKPRRFPWIHLGRAAKKDPEEITRNYTPHQVFQARARLAVVSNDWKLNVRKSLKALKNAIEMSMNEVFLKMTLKDETLKKSASVFPWNVPIKVSYRKQHEKDYSIELKLERQRDEVTGWSDWKLDEYTLEAALGLWVSSLVEEKKKREEEGETDRKNVWLVGPATDLFKREYGIWIRHAAPHRNIKRSSEAVRCFGWIAEDGGDEFISIDTSHTLERICTQQLYFIFLQSLVGIIQTVGGETTKRLDETNVTGDRPDLPTTVGLADFSLKNTNLASIATIFKDCNLGTIEEAYCCIIPAFQKVEKPPPPLKDFEDAQEMSSTLAEQGSWRKSLDIDMYLKKAIGLAGLSQREITIVEAKLYSRLRQLTKLLVEKIADARITDNIQHLEPMWSSLYGRCKLMSSGIVPAALGPDLMVLCLTRYRIRGDDDLDELRELLSATFQSLNPKVTLPQDIETAKYAMLFHEPDLLTRFVWSVSIERRDVASLPAEVQMPDDHEFSGVASNGSTYPREMLERTLSHHPVSKVMIEARRMAGYMFASSVFINYFDNPQSAEGMEDILSIEEDASKRLSRLDRAESVKIPRPGGKISATLSWDRRSRADRRESVESTRTWERRSRADRAESVDSKRTSGGITLGPFASGCRSQKSMAGASAIKAITDDEVEDSSYPIDLLLIRGYRTPLQMAAELNNMAIVEYICIVCDFYNKPDHPAPTGGMTALQAAAARGYMSIVHYLITRGAPINDVVASVSGRTALQAAAEGEHEDIVQYLVMNGANVDAPPAPELGVTALQAAARRGNLKIMRMLLEKKPLLNEPASGSGRTPLQEAAECGHDEVIKLLLHIRRDAQDSDHGIIKVFPHEKADINAPPAPRGGRTALQGAAEKGHLSTVVLLLDNDADVNGPPAKEFGLTALQAAAGAGWKQIVELLIKARAVINAEAADVHGRTALYAAVEGGHHEVVKHLLDSGAQIVTDRTEPTGKTILQATIESGKPAIIRLILKAPFDLEAALYYARIENQDNVLNDLLKRDELDINRVDRLDGTTALIRASMHGHTDVVDWLVRRGGIDVNIQDRNGRTALAIAAECGFTEIVEKLLPERVRAYVNLADSKGWTPLISAASKGYVKVVQVLLSDKRVDPRLLTRTGSSCLLETVTAALDLIVDQGGVVDHGRVVEDILRHRLSKGLENSADEHGTTPLIMAAKKRLAPIIRQLLAREDLKVNHKDKMQRTAFSITSESNDRVVEILLLNDPRLDLDLQELFSKDPSIFVLGVKHGAKTLVGRLLQTPGIEKVLNQADQASQGKPAITIAIENENLEIVKMLLAEKSIELDKQALTLRTSQHITTVLTNYFQSTREDQATAAEQSVEPSSNPHPSPKPSQASNTNPSLFPDQLANAKSALKAKQISSTESLLSPYPDAQRTSIPEPVSDAQSEPIAQLPSNTPQQPGRSDSQTESTSPTSRPSATPGRMVQSFLKRRINAMAGALISQVSLSSDTGRRGHTAPSIPTTPTAFPSSSSGQGQIPDLGRQGTDSTLDKVADPVSRIIGENAIAMSSAERISNAEMERAINQGAGVDPRSSADENVNTTSPAHHGPLISMDSTIISAPSLDKDQDTGTKPISAPNVTADPTTSTGSAPSTTGLDLTHNTTDITKGKMDLNLSDQSELSPSSGIPMDEAISAEPNLGTDLAASTDPDPSVGPSSIKEGKMDPKLGVQSEPSSSSGKMDLNLSDQSELSPSSGMPADEAISAERNLGTDIAPSTDPDPIVGPSSIKEGNMDPKLSDQPQLSLSSGKIDPNLSDQSELRTSAGITADEAISAEPHLKADLAQSTNPTPSEQPSSSEDTSVLAANPKPNIAKHPVTDSNSTADSGMAGDPDPIPSTSDARKGDHDQAPTDGPTPSTDQSSTPV